MTKSQERKRVVRLLRAGANAIRKFGWIKGQYGDKECGFCAVGAVMYADERARAGGACTLAVSAMSMVLRDKGNTLENVVDYNDSLNTTRGQVLRLFKAAERKVQELV